MRINPGTFGAGKSQICQLPDWTWIETNGESGYVLQQPLASALLRNGSTDEAIDAIQRQFSVNPSVHSPILAFIRELRRSGASAELGVVLRAYLQSAEPRRTKCRIFDNRALRDLLTDSELRGAFVQECTGYANYTLALTENDPVKKVELLTAAVADEPRHPAAHGELALALLASAGDVDQGTIYMLRQININPVASVDQIFDFVRRAGTSGRTEKEVEVYTAFLGSVAPARLKCRRFENLDTERLNEFSDFLTLLKSTCPEPHPG